MRLSATILLTLFAGLLFGQQPTVTVKLPKNAKAGDTVKATVEVQVPAGWHAYSNPPTSPELIPLAVTKLEGAKLKSVKYPKAKTIDFAGKMVGGYEGKVSIPIQFAVAKDAKAPLNLKVTVHYQMCNDQTCGMPGDVFANAKLAVVKKNDEALAAPAKPTDTIPPVVTAQVPSKQDVAPEPAKTAPAIATAPKNQGYEEGLAGRLVDWYKSGKWYLLFPSLLLVGLLINLTPCVYPVIAPTAGFIAKQSEGAVGGRFAFGLVFLFGAAAMFTVIGTIFGLSGTVFGSLYQQPWFTIGLGILMMALALAMFDVYQIRLPNALASGMRGRAGLIGALMMGMFIGVAAVPCGGPVIAAAAATAFQTRDTVFASLVFAGIGLGIGLPVAVLIMTGALGVLAKPGEWMVTVKHVLGLAVIASGIYFLSFTLRPAIGSLGMAWVWTAYFVAAAFYLIALDHTGRTRTGLLAFKGIVAIGAVLYGGLMLANIANEAKTPQIVSWQAFDLSNFDAALGKGRPIVIDFRSDWCAMCREIEDKTFSDPKVQAVLAKMVAFRADETTANPTIESWNRRFGIATLPDVIFFDGQGNQVRRFKTFFDTDEFADASKSAGL